MTAVGPISDKKIDLGSDASAFVVSSHASGDNTRQKKRDNYSCGLGERSSWQKIMKSSGTLATSLSRFDSIR